MRAWTDRPFGPVTQLAEVAGRGAVISTENGQSTVLYESSAHPGWLVKLYRPGFPEEPDDMLDRLIALPGEMSDPDRLTVDNSVCWPVSRIVDGDKTVGVILAKAAKEFFATLRLPSGVREECHLDLDQLVPPDPGFYKRRGWAPPTWEERMLVARNLLVVGALFERYGVVYGDWSYANAFWARGTGRVFVIDADACGLTDRAWVETNSWADPHVKSGDRLDVRSDRYKVALGVLRCLSGVRGDPRKAYEALPERVKASELGRQLLAGVTGEPDLRPVSGALLELLETERDAPGTQARSVRTPTEARTEDSGRRAEAHAPRVESKPSARKEPPAETRVPPEELYVPEPDDEEYVTGSDGDYVPFVQDTDRPTGLERWLMPFIVCCAALIVLLVVAGVAKFISP